MGRTRCAIALLTAGVALTMPVRAAAELTFVWEDPFSAAERTKLEAWLNETHDAVERLVGPFPMGVRAHLHRRDGSREPVPWARTERDETQGIHFYVDAGFSLDAFRHDWTAPHELSHLILPYVGRHNAWFAEGFASYMQYRVMESMGVLTPEAAASRYRDHLEGAERRYGYSAEPFVEAAPTLRAQRQFAVMYWGGAAYFMQVDEALRADGSSLVAVLRAYMKCCRRDRARLDELLTSLDELAPGPVFTECYRRFAARPGFPEVDDIP